MQACGGTDNYTNAISDVYQDNFGEGIFTGKGIYDLNVFSKVLKGTIPENTVLSHDLLEGNYLRCGLVSDILLLDGYPAKFNSYMARMHRWIRGDWQIVRWLGKSVLNEKNERTENPLDILSKFKILDNLRRSLVPIIVLILIFLSAINIGSLALAIIALIMPTILDIINIIVFRKEIGSNFIIAGKSFAKGVNAFLASILSSIFEIAFLPYKAYVNLNAIIKSIYRMCVSKQNLLEWITAEDAEKQAKGDLKSYYKAMCVNIIASAESIALYRVNISFLVLRYIIFNWTFRSLVYK